MTYHSIGTRGYGNISLQVDLGYLTDLWSLCIGVLIHGQKRRERFTLAAHCPTPCLHCHLPIRVTNKNPFVNNEHVSSWNACVRARRGRRLLSQFHAAIDFRELT